MKSGMLAAEAVADMLGHEDAAAPESYDDKLRGSWLWDELSRVRNIRPGFARFGFWGGMANAAVDTFLFGGHAPWTLHHREPDHTTLRPAGQCEPIAYPRPDGVLTFDRLSSVYISNTSHEESQPAHLHLADPERAIAVNWERFRSPETRYCPAGVYEIVGAEEGKPALQVNFANCLHCKTCDIKDPTQNITWVAPEGGGGPNYPGGM
jgi:electron-transferring-flavoprotein dehydrogenase